MGIMTVAPYNEIVAAYNVLSMHQLLLCIRGVFLRNIWDGLETARYIY